MNGFRKLQERLTAEGWYVGWAELCCQSCAWDCLPEEHETGPFEGQDVDFAKVLFNHEQDVRCENDAVFKKMNDYHQEGYVTMETYSPEQQDCSKFCFEGSEEGIKNLKAIIPIIEECGCEIHWNGKGNTRPDISWSN